tara:strand:+ start:4766 stop:6187 length:1422 start_codon:yes stop_codon:yes gene_type:complete
MEGGPKFRKANETPHGSSLEHSGDPDFRELGPGERRGLRGLLGGLGVPLKEDLEGDDEDEEPESPGRRGFILGAAAATAVAMTPTRLGDGTVESVEVESEIDPAVESVEELNNSEVFDAEVSGYEAFTKLQKDEVLYLDETGRPVGEVTLESFDGPLPEGVTVKDGQAPVYHYSIGELDETGLPAGKIPPRWRKFKQAELQAEHPDRQIARDLNVIADFQAAYNESDEPELVAKIANGEIDSYDEIVEYFIDKPVEGSGLNRVEYLRENVQFRNELETIEVDEGVVEFIPVPPVVQEELRRLLPAVFAQESKFNEGLVNPRSGAKGPGQFMSDTWQRYTGSAEVSSKFTDQVEVLGPAVSDMYDRLFDKIGLNATDVLQQQFPDEESFLVDLIVPLVISSYNAGPDRVAEAAKKYIEQGASEDTPTGKDLFIAIVNFAEESSEGLLGDYDEDSREYVPRVYGNSAMLEEKYRK